MTEILTIYISAAGTINPSIYTRYFLNNPVEEVHGCLGTMKEQNYNNLYDLANKGNKLRFECDTKRNFDHPFFTKQDIVSTAKHNFKEFIKTKYSKDVSEQVKKIDEIILQTHLMVELY